MEARIQNTEEGPRLLWDYVKPKNIRITGVPEGAQEKQGVKNVLEETTRENVPNLVKDIDTRAQDAPQQGDPEQEHRDTSSLKRPKSKKKRKF